MRQIKFILLSVVALAGLSLWDDRPGQDVPKWLFLLAMAPLAWVGLTSNDDSDENAEAENGFALLYLFAASIFLMIIGALGKAMPGTWGALLEPALYLGAIAFAMAIVVLIFRSRS